MDDAYIVVYRGDGEETAYIDSRADLWAAIEAYAQCRADHDGGYGWTDEMPYECQDRRARVRALLGLDEGDEDEHPPRRAPDDEPNGPDEASDDEKRDEPGIGVMVHALPLARVCGPENASGGHPSMSKLTREEALARLRAILEAQQLARRSNRYHDVEMEHLEVDGILLDVIDDDEVRQVFGELILWYA